MHWESCQTVFMEPSRTSVWEGEQAVGVRRRQRIAPLLLHCIRGHASAPSVPPRLCHSLAERAQQLLLLLLPLALHHTAWERRLKAR